MENDQDKLENYYQARLSDKKDTSGRIGETSRFIAFGIVALVFTIHGSSSSISGHLIQYYEGLLNLAGLLACLSILSDYLQYLFGYFSVNQALQRRHQEYTYNKKSYFYRGRSTFFWAKQLLAFVSGILVIFCIATAVLSA